MSNVFVDKNKLDILANAISNKSGESLTLTLDEMVEAVDGIEQGGGGITPTGNVDITQAGVTDVTNYATATVPQGDVFVGASIGYYTENGVRKWHIRPYASVDLGEDEGAVGFIGNGYYNSPNDFVRNAIDKNTTVTPTESAQTIGGANYMMEGAVTVSAMPSGTAGTPTATKGAVSNHSVSVTPSVTNTTGYITGSTKTGTAVTVSASELVSGSETKTANGTYDVTNLASLVVNVSGGTSKNAQVVQGTTRTTSSTLTAIGAEMTVSKTGTYNVYWSAFRSNTSSQYTFATKLYINGTGYGSEQTTWSNHQQNVHLSNVSLSANDKIRVYGRESRGSSYYMYAGTLTIIEA